MPTIYDVFAKIIEKAPCRIVDLDFKVPVYAHVDKLTKNNWVRKKDNKLTPLKNETTQLIFKIIRYCLNHGLNHNVFFKKSMKIILKNLPESLPDLRPKPLEDKKEVSNILRYLEEYQFILKYSKRPATGRLLKHQLLKTASDFHDLSLKIKPISRIGLTKKIHKIKTEPINPFDKKIFSFLAGSAQLEGSTITEGETIELLLHDIYPEKPSKDIQMVKNLNEALRYLIENLDKEITTYDIKEINKRIMFTLHANAGKYKLSQNKIQGNPYFKTTPPKQVPAEIETYCEEMNQTRTKEDCLKKLGFIHNQLQRIHPFADGNSRTTRMILNWFLLKHDLPIVIIKMGAFDEYMSLTKLSNQRDDNRLNQVFHELIVHESLIKS